MVILKKIPNKNLYKAQCKCTYCKTIARSSESTYDDGDVRIIKDFEYEIKSQGWLIEKKTVLLNGEVDYVEFCSEECYQNYVKKVEDQQKSLELEGKDKDVLEFVLSSNGKYYIVDKYNSNDPIVIIPETYKGLPVKEISETAFKNNKTLKEITITKNINKIGKSRFESCINLEKVIIEKGVKTTGNNTFKNCVNLKHISIPDTISKLDQYCFYGIKSINVLEIPGTVITMDFNCLNDVDNIDNIYYDGYIGDWAQINIEYHSAPLRVCKNFYYKNENGEFEYKNKRYSLLTSDVIIGGVEIIKTRTFTSCKKIESITLLDSVKKVESKAFDFCSNVHTVEFSNSVKTFGGFDTYFGKPINNVYFNGTIEEWNNIEFLQINNNEVYKAKNLYILDDNGDIERNGKKYVLYNRN